MQSRTDALAADKVAALAEAGRFRARYLEAQRDAAEAAARNALLLQAWQPHWGDLAVLALPVRAKKEAVTVVCSPLLRLGSVALVLALIYLLQN